MERIYFEIFFDKRIETKHRTAFVAAGDDEPVAHGFDTVGFPFTRKAAPKAGSNVFKPCRGLNPIERDQDHHRAGANICWLGQRERATSDFLHIAHEVGGS